MRFPDFAATEQLILRAVKLGINFFDTAYIYRNSEETLGRIIEKHGLRDKINLATKLPLLYCKKESDFEKYFARQLERLRTEYIDYYFMHMLVDATQWERLCGLGILDFLAEKKAAGQIRRVGFSFHGSQNAFIELLDVYDWDFCMIQYNYRDEHYQAGAAGLRAAAEKGLPVIIMEPLLGGQLAVNLPKKAVELFAKAGGTGPALTPADWAFKWLWDQPKVTCVLSGMQSMPVLEANAANAAASPAGCLSDEQKGVFDRVAEVFRETEKVRCTGCNYCMPCPRGVNIPACFSAWNINYAIGRITGLKRYAMSNGITGGQFGGASRCNGCKKCEKHCPQGIKVAETLKVVRRKMEPFWMRWLMKAARRFTGA